MAYLLQARHVQGNRQLSLLLIAHSGASGIWHACCRCGTPCAADNFILTCSCPTEAEGSEECHVSSDAGSIGRQTALFSLVVALTRRLRAVFVPYFRYLVDAIVGHLGGDAAAGSGSAEKPKKKKKRQTLSAGSAGGSSADGPLLCFRVILQWHRMCVGHVPLLSNLVQCWRRALGSDWYD